MCLALAAVQYRNDYHCESTWAMQNKHLYDITDPRTLAILLSSTHNVWSTSNCLSCLRIEKRIDASHQTIEPNHKNTTRKQAPRQVTSYYLWILVCMTKEQKSLVS
jgi:hypothetical protein